MSSVLWILQAFIVHEMKKEKTNNPKKYVTTSISFDKQLLELAKARAESLGMTFSEYVCRCLDNETSSGGEFVIRPKQTKEKEW